jgi:tRNA pseudouridine38-40 synthase
LPDGEVVRDLTKIVLVLEYEGTNYCGFQFQENGTTVQSEVEKAVLQLTGESLRVVCASRTDAGVHAKGQVACFRTGSRHSEETFLKGLNNYLPQDIAVKAAYKVDESFNIQMDAISREYRYYIFNSPARSPLWRKYSYQVVGKLDLEAMNEAAQSLIGEHDFSSFVTCFDESVKSTVRTVHQAHLERKGDLVVFEIVARSFLRHQVRNTIGTLIRIGTGKITIEDFQGIMEAKKPGLAGPTTPAHGLFLMRVNYPGPFRSE